MGFTERKVSPNAVCAMILGIVLLTAHAVMIVLSVLSGGNLPFPYGTAESYVALFGLFGIFWAVLSYDDEKTVNTYKAAGIILNGLSLALSAFVMAVGFMSYEV